MQTQNSTYVLTFPFQIGNVSSAFLAALAYQVSHDLVIESVQYGGNSMTIQLNRDLTDSEIASVNDIVLANMVQVGAWPPPPPSC